MTDEPVSMLNDEQLAARRAKLVDPNFDHSVPEGSVTPANDPHGGHVAHSIAEPCIPQCPLYRREPEIVVNGELMGYGQEGMLRALAAMLDGGPRD